MSKPLCAQGMSIRKSLKINIPPLSFIAYGKLLALSFSAFLGLFLLFTLVSHVFSVELWEAAAGLNSIIALVIIFLSLKKSPQFFSGAPVISYLPGLLVFFAALLMGLLMSLGKFEMGKMSEIATVQSLFIICVIVPISEEFVFRIGLTSLTSKIGGLFWGSFFSVLVFTSLHMVSSWEELFQGNFGGNPLGPFLLGVLAEIIYRKWNNIFAAIFFHMACNLTPYIFYVTEPRWLKWLSALYN